MQPARAALVSTTRDGATIQPPLPSEERREVHGGLSCEIVSDLCPNPFSHDWHVQPSCQRPNRLPPERRAFSSRRTHYKSESGCPRNLLNISFARDPVNACIPQHFHVISTFGKVPELNAALGETFQSFRGVRASRSLKP